MSAYPSLPLFTDAFISDTMHLSAQETGAYLMLMMVAWRSPDCRLADDDDRLARFARVDRRTWARIKPTILEFWTLQDGFWSQKRLSKEREFVSKRAEVNRKNGEQGGRPKSLENNDAQNPAGSVRVSEKKAPNPNPSPNREDNPQDPNGSCAPKGARQPRKPRNRALPTDWQPGSASEIVRAELGRSIAWMHETATDMRTWAASKGEIRADWDATHVGWMRREAKRESERPSVRAGPSREKQTAVTAFADRMEARRDRHQHQDQGSFRTDPAPVIDHEADGRFDRQVYEPAGGPRLGFSPEAPIRLVGSRWR